MSDSRRRRKTPHSGDSDELSDSYDELNVTKETQSSEAIEDHHDSEYGTAGSESETESQEGVLRESGDGQEEEKPQKKLDDDEDRRNPQYIPKRGTFYEHDDRTAEEVAGGEKAIEPQVERETKEKKVWKDKEDKWNHDRYNDEEQAPKSHEELIAIYGYDIRNEEGPPRARRRRRYGRGPNKYTRNWEDEDAYGKVAGSTPNKSSGRKSDRSNEEFPALDDSNKDSPKPEEPVISSAWYSNKSKSPGKVNFPPLVPQQDGHKSNQNSAQSSKLNENKIPAEVINQTWKRENKQASQIQSSNGNTGCKDIDKPVRGKALPRDSNKRNVQESASLAASRVRGRGFKANTNNNIVGNQGIDSKQKGRGPGIMNPGNRRVNAARYDDEHQLANDVKHMNIAESAFNHSSVRQNKHFQIQSTSQESSTAIPPRLQQSRSQQPTHQQQVHSPPPPAPQDGIGNRPKRYSSLRQRPPITEGPGQSNYQAPHAPHTYYPTQGYPQGPFEQPSPVAPSTAPMAGQPVIPLPAAPQPPTYAQPPPFLVPPPQFMPPQTAPPSIINFVSGPNGPPFQPNFQGYQGYTPTSVPPQGPPPQELFQPQGCTYYSPAQQHQQQQPVRRPKAAIPILPPPDNQQQFQTPRGRGKNKPQQQHKHNEFQQHYQDVRQEQQQEFHQKHQQEFLQQLKHQEILQQQQHQDELQVKNQLELKQPKLQQELEQRQLEEAQPHQQETELHQQEHQPDVQHHVTQKLQWLTEQPQEGLQQHVRKVHEQHFVVGQEQEVQQSRQEVQQQKMNFSEPLTSQKIEIEDQVQPVDVSLYNDKEKFKIIQTEQLEKVNVQKNRLKIVPEVLEKMEGKSIDITVKSRETSEVVDSVNEAPVKLNALVVDETVTPSRENILMKGESESTALKSPFVEEAAA
ncbi:protein CASC3-like isoform X2 [Belonocnema kinseyi]|uniref:protein CASC3-like isoform X2 n=1 Tax=Belonocnema kinseyi TaxID=2817044 RepID=UPI00143D6734|nr:protein CASC3-like isoform X2 [Belonocnema kinseyi]